jgi:putative zinc finger/helix-turn-helix YgiT family protein
VSFRAEGEKSDWAAIAGFTDFSLRSASFEMTEEEIRRIRKKLGLTQEAAGLMIGGGPRAFQKYENSDLLPSRAISSALVLLDRDPRALRVLKARQVKTSAPRHTELRP